MMAIGQFFLISKEDAMLVGQVKLDHMKQLLATVLVTFPQCCPLLCQ
jgi:hypothetical protein